MNELSPKECHICDGKKFKGFTKYCTVHKCKCGGFEICQEKKKCDGCNFFKVHNDNHITGNFIGAAHSYCNINYWILSKQTPIPVIFHNLKGYDAHHIIGSIYNVKNVETSGVIDESGEKCKSFVLREKE